MRALGRRARELENLALEDNTKRQYGSAIRAVRAVSGKLLPMDTRNKVGPP